MALLAFLAALVVIGTPILAILAYARVQRLADQVNALPLQSLLSRLYALEHQLSSIEKSLAGASEPTTPPTPPPTAQREAPSTAPPAPPAPQATERPATPHQPQPPSFPPPPRPSEALPAPTRPNVFAAPPLHASVADSAPPVDLETRIAGRWFNRIGITLLIGAVTFFLKYAFDNNWIGPSGRVAIGILLGSAMFPWSHWLLRRGYSYFSEGIAALGAAVLYLSIWAGCQYYHLYSRDVGFYGMIVITAAISIVALGRDSQRIALLSLIGGFLTPLLVSSGRDEQVVLFTYLLILGAGMIVIEARREWLLLAPVSFLLTEFYFIGWYSEFYKPAKLELTIIFATLIFLLYAVLPILRAARHSRLNEVDILLVLVNSFSYFGGLYVMLWPQDRWPLTLFALALSAGHLVVSRLLPAPKACESPVTRLIFAGLALTFVTLAIPIRLDGKWITLAFAIEGAILVSTGFRSAENFLRHAGYLLIALAGLRILVFPLPAPQFLVNERFAAFLVLIACLGACLYAARLYSNSITPSEEAVLGVFAVAINIYALIALSQELWDYFGHQAGLGIDSGLAQHLALSLLWTAYASVLIFFGVQRQSVLLRWQSLVLFGLVVVKVFVYDSSYLERFYRIVSFFILGLVLLTVSFLYQRKFARGNSSR
jgi:uncharacterized membrane protein